jgi:uncharacterized protein (TIGR03435 family)
MRRATLACGSLLLAGALLTAQAPAADFDVVSIKRSPPDATGNSIQNLPDGTFVLRNGTIRSILLGASPIAVREIEGYPAWVDRERYDITAKPPAGATRQQRAEMMRRMFGERMKLKGHIEERERNVFALVLARGDGSLGPQLKPSTLDCLAPVPPRTAPDPPAPPDTRCGGSFGAGSIVSGGIRIVDVLPFFSNLAGRPVIDRTGLTGFFALTLRWAPRASNPDAPVDDTPDFFTAIQEQLGLKVQPDTMKMPIFIVDSIERPSEN